MLKGEGSVWAAFLGGIVDGDGDLVRFDGEWVRVRDGDADASVEAHWYVDVLFAVRRRREGVVMIDSRWSG